MLNVYNYKGNPHCHLCVCVCVCVSLHLQHEYQNTHSPSKEGTFLHSGAIFAGCHNFKGLSDGIGMVLRVMV